jgi:ATP-dependent RNA helicase DDX46/PRP5
LSVAPVALSVVRLSGCCGRYVHRVGRTGRAGHKGTAYTFVTHEEECHAEALVLALQQSGNGQHVPRELVGLAESHAAKVKAGTARASSSGFQGKGYF